ncbi:hypothetical protein PV328_005749 [Microctonus aethiopoides]|uniref:MCM C-terminal AAA(+) ATPase domain-containing protein n=1 Tax=Microctonus aethiopoides TaxID=144406 RepID=A0AA39FMM1_9HYME|nr:hypothetical protein PV328_005749 [Microctonus aethiopoides]
MGRPYKRFGKNYHNTNHAHSVKKRSAAESNGAFNGPTKDKDNLISLDDPSLNVYSLTKDSHSDYYGAKLYFNDENITKDTLLIRKIKAAENFMDRNPDITTIIPQKTGPAFNINVDRFINDEQFINEWYTFENDLQDKPRETLNCLGLALHQIIVKTAPKDDSNNSLHIKNLPMIRAKIINYRPVISVSEIKVNNYGKLISTRGCVIRVGRTRHLAQWISFECIKCNTYKIVKQPDGIYTVPKSCDNCGVSKFEPKLDSPYVKTVPLQVIKLQEHLEAMQDDRGKMPRIIEVELLDDLVGICAPGDDVTVVGIIKVRNIDDGARKGKDTLGPSALYMEGVSIVNNKNKSQSKNATGMELDMRDYFSIKEIHDNPDVFSLLIRSMCPAIYGHEMIKAGLLLSLFGGSSSQTSPRDDIHVLMVGDPGLGKSQLLQASTRLSPQGVYVCGNSSTSSGLTVTLSKENGTNDFALEPGALVLADKGSCLIDEFDKMPTQHQALLETMEQQSVSVAKSGIICSLQARTSIIAAANPIGGRYDASKPIMSNLNLSQPLLSRFDLIFLLLDQPNEHLDSMMCAHVMNAHTGFKQVLNNKDTSHDITLSSTNQSQFRSLKERLVKSVNDSKDTVLQSILRKYISYARQYVNPRLSRSAANVLQQYYLELRKNTNIFGSLPVFHRQLEALIRLTQARAKLELRMEATENDALEVVELYKYTLASVPPPGIPTHLSADAGKLTTKKVNAFIYLLAQAAECDERLFSRNDLIELANEGGIIIRDFSRFISKLNNEGILLKRGNDAYKFINQ